MDDCENKQAGSRDSDCAIHPLINWCWKQHLQPGDEEDDSFSSDKQDKVETCLESSGQRVMKWYYNDSPVSYIYDSCMELLSIGEASPYHLTSRVTST